MSSHILHPDTQAILLLCGSLGQPRTEEAPLTQGEYNQVAQWLQQEHLRPADLLQPDGIDRVRGAGATLLLSERVLTLVSRGAALALAVERWTNNGLWIMARSDPAYPPTLRDRLGRQAPALLYGVGEQTLLERGGLAIVGSRDADADGLDFARTAAQTCSEQGVMVISGGARGVDKAAMDAAIAAGGSVLGVLADSLARTAVARRYRSAIREGQLVFVSPFDPDAGFNVGNAMSRNKIIYALSDLALVVSTALETGGTWHGATENIRQGWVPLFVRSAEPQLPGNQRLIDLGGYRVDQSLFSRRVDVDAWLDGRVYARSSAMPLAAEEGENHAPAVPPTTAARPEPTQCSLNRADADRVQQQNPEATQRHADLFPIVWPHLCAMLETPHTDREVADICQIELKQARLWLQRATDQGLLIKLSRPVRYVVARSASQAALPFSGHELA